MSSGVQSAGQLCLITRTRGLQCALPLSHVIEIMRPLPVEPIAHAPSFVLGVAIVRGLATPVVDCGVILQGSATIHATRWASIRCGERSAALAFDAILGVRALPAYAGDLPPLLSGAPSETIAGLATLDAQLLLVLDGSRLVPESAWTAIDARGAT